jgi:hypothetical protein
LRDRTYRRMSSPVEILKAHSQVNLKMVIVPS